MAVEMKNMITTGNLLQIGTTLVSLVVFVMYLDAKATNALKGVEDHEQRIRNLEVLYTTLGRMDLRLGNIEKQLDLK